jgi:hypothetical protein
VRKVLPWLVLTLLLLALGLGVVQLRRLQPDIRFPVETVDVIVPHDTTSTSDPTLANGQTRVATTGKDGLLRKFTYFEERWVGDTLQERKQIVPQGKPASEWVTTPTVEVVTVGTKGIRVYQLDAANSRGLLVGRIGRTGAFSFHIGGSITFAGPLSVCGPLGNPGYAYAHRPIRSDVAPGAALVRTGSGRWLSLAQIGGLNGVYTVTGKVGAPVWAIVNDAPRFFGDNRGSFAISAVVSRG